MQVEEIYSSDFIDEIIQHNVNRNLIRYNLFMKFIMNQTFYPEEKRIAMKVYEQSKKIPSGALAAVFSDPTFSYWIYLSSCLKKRLENGEEIPDTDLPYLVGISNKESGNALKYHLLEINRFLFSAAILSRTDIEGEVLILEDAFYLPILGIYFIPGKKTPFSLASFSMLNDKAVFKIGKRIFDHFEKILFLAEKGLSQFFQNDGIFIQASILGAGGKMIVDRVDPYIRLGWSTLYKNPDGSGYLSLDLDEIKKEMPIFLDAFNLIQDYWPEMASNISTTIRSIHVVKSPHHDRHMSCTSDQFFGSILTSTGDQYQLAEAIVHEYSHNLLNMIIMSGEVFDGPIPKEEIYYSPWRDDPRHISGVLHAVFVFTNVSELLDRLSNAYPDVEYLKIRKIDNLIRLRMGIEILKDYPFNKPFALVLIADLENKISNLENRYKNYDFTSSQILQRNHLEKWIENFGDLNRPKMI
jgi:hypothetical protein